MVNYYHVGSEQILTFSDLTVCSQAIHKDKMSDDSGVREKLLKELDGVKADIIAPPIAWSCELPDKPATILPSFSLEKVGHAIEVPVSKKVPHHQFTLHVTLNNRIYYSTKDLKILLDKKTGGSVQHDYGELYVSHYYIHGSKVTSMIPSSPFTTSVLPKLVATAMANHFKEMSIATEDVEAKLSHLVLYRAMDEDDECGDNDDPFDHYYSFVNRKCKGKAIIFKFSCCADI